MVGFYPDAPAPRMAYDEDGTIAVVVAGTISGVAGATLTALNNESLTGANLGVSINQPLAFLFPELRDFSAYWIWTDHFFSNPGAVETSVDTTNGQDGTWTLREANYVNAPPVLPNYRTAIHPLVVTGIKSIRFTMTASASGTWQKAHLYGDFSAASDRLSFWQPVTDAQVGPAYFDFGNVYRTITNTKQFRIKNRSATLTATSIVVSLEEQTVASPTMVSQYQFSTDGTTFTNTINIGSLAPGAISPVLYVRYSVNVAAALGLWSPRILAKPAAFV